MKYLLILLFLYSTQGFSNTINIKKALICDYKEIKGMSLDRYKFLIEFERESHYSNLTTILTCHPTVLLPYAFISEKTDILMMR